MQDGDTQLRTLLEVERERCARLALILDAERSAAASYDHTALLACLKEREGVQAEWYRASTTRRKLLRRDGLTLDAAVAGDAGLSDLVRALRAEAEVVRRAQRINEGLVRSALAQVTDLLTVIKRELPETQYDGRASLRTPSPVTRADWSA